jgi:hypothetical protein
MNKLLCVYFFFAALLSFPVQAQILNGGFENWVSGEPLNWFTNNSQELSAYPITQSSFAHGGTSSLKGEVIGIDINGQTVPYPPYLLAGDTSGNYFPYTSKPEVIKGYYHFESVEGDGITANIFLFNDQYLIAVSEFTTYTSTGPGFYEMTFNMAYLDTVAVPDRIEFVFQVVSSGINTHIGSVFYIDDFPKVTLIKPAEAAGDFPIEQPVFISGETDTIKWSSGGAEYVNIEYSLDDGASYNTVVINYPGDSSRYFWHVPDNLKTRKAKIQITDSELGNDVKSINFTIKPWQLTRIDASGELELFKPEQDGWNFENGDDMWPPSWYQQFDYQFGDDPITDLQYPYEEPFLFAKSSDFCDWPLFVEVFDTSQCFYFGLIYRSDAESYWGSIKSDWGGSCFGFSVTSLLGFYHKSDFLNLFPDIGNFTDLYNVALDNDTRKAINNIFITQFGKQTLDSHRNHAKDTPMELLSDLKTMFRKENGDGRALYFRNSSNTAAHSVVPYKMVRNGNSSTFSVKLYDSNHPGITGIISIDSVNDSWTDSTGLNWGTNTVGCYLELESGDFLSTPILEDSPAQYAAGDSPLGDPSRIFIYNTDQSDIVITSGSGEQIGYQDSVGFNNTSDAFLINPATASFHPPIGYDLPKDNYSLELNNYMDSSAYVYFFGDSTIYSYRRYSAVNNETDYLNFKEDGLGIVNPDQLGKNIYLETIILEDTTSEKKFVTNDIQVSMEDSIHITEKDRNKLMLQNYGSSMDYDLLVSTSSSNFKSVFTHDNIQMAQNSAHLIVPVWENLANEPVKILIDLGNDGTIDDSMFVTNQYTGIEIQNYAGIPTEFKLLQNFPNPFNPVTTINYELPVKGFVTLKVYDILGREVATLVNEQKNQGRYSVTFDASGMATGVYIYQLRANDHVFSRKMLLLK